MTTQRQYIALTYDGPEEDRACQAVAFTWAWTEFQVTVDGDSRPGQLLIHSINLEDQARFKAEFVPALNAELTKAGFAPCYNVYGNGSHYFDLDDPNDQPTLMEMLKFLMHHGEVDRRDLFSYKGEGAKEKVVAMVRPISGRWFEDVGRGLRI